MTIRQSLFDDMERTDASLKQHNEPLFACLNRSARREVTEIRNRLEPWFERFPVEAQHDVSGKVSRGWTIMLIKERSLNCSCMNCSIAWIAG